MRPASLLRLLGGARRDARVRAHRPRPGGSRASSVALRSAVGTDDLGGPLLPRADLLRPCGDPGAHHAVPGPVRAPRRAREAQAGQAASREPGRVLRGLPDWLVYGVVVA